MAVKKSGANPSGNKKGHTHWKGLGDMETRAVKLVLDGLVETGAHRATSYLAANRLVRGTRPMMTRNGKKVFVENGKEMKVVLCIGRPNVKEREFIKKFRKTVGTAYPQFGTDRQPTLGVWFQYPAKTFRVVKKAKNRR